MSETFFIFISFRHNKTPLKIRTGAQGGITKNPSIDNMIAIARVLESLVEDLVDTDPEPYTPTTIAAHHDGEWTESELDEIARFKEFVRAKREQK